MSPGYLSLISWVVVASSLPLYRQQPYFEFHYDERGIPIESEDSEPIQIYQYSDLDASPIHIIRTSSEQGRLFMFSSDDIWTDYCAGQDTVTTRIF